jgi:hypothetical protein
MIARKQEIGLQLNQFIDALLMGAVFWLCHFLEVAEVTYFFSMLALIFPVAFFLPELLAFTLGSARRVFEGWNTLVPRPLSMTSSTRAGRF